MATTTPRSEGLRVDELAAWRGLLRAHALLSKRLDAALETEHGLALTSFEVLDLLGAEGEHRMRMCDVAVSVGLSRSGLTRLVDRLEREGLVERVSCPSDARGAFAALTATGRARLEAARPTHVDAVRAGLLEHVTPDELALLASVWERVVEAAPCTSPRCD
jgi:DNA-binding MarR family transcriptional regulator